MIVTRQRRKSFPWKRLILPVIAIALVVFAFTWTPSRNVITNGPMAPLWRASGNAYGTVAKPFNFAAQNELLTERNKQILALQKQVSDLQAQTSAKDKKIGDLNGQVQQAQLQAANPKPAAANSTTNATVAAAQSSASGATGDVSASQNTGSDLASGASPDMRRTASFWGNMEPENAAKVIERLPVPYVAHVMALMSPDAVGAILDALPPVYAAKLTQDHPELKK